MQTMLLHKNTMEIISAEDFRTGMRQLAGAVTIVTTDGQAGKGGFTATAVCSVSDSPPSLLVCVNRANELNQIMRENAVFCVNVLNHAQEALANRFAGFDKVPMPERLLMGNWQVLQTGAPSLTDAITSFDCRLETFHEAGSHTIMIGHVVAVRTASGLAPLMYHDRRYRSVADLQTI